MVYLFCRVSFNLGVFLLLTLSHNVFIETDPQKSEVRLGIFPPLHSNSFHSYVTMKQKSQDTKTQRCHISYFPFAAYKWQCQVLPAQFIASAFLCFPYAFPQLSIHSCPDRENVLSLLIISHRTEMKTHDDTELAFFYLLWNIGELSFPQFCIEI